MDLDKVKPKPLGNVPSSPEHIRLQDYRPQSIFKIPETSIVKAAFPVIDIHTHAWQPELDVSRWIARMDDANIEKSIVLTFETGAGFDAVTKQYAGYASRFDLWCGFDYTGYDQPGSNWTDHAVAELERCHRMGAKGVGELGDKGLGEFYSRPVAGYGLHLDDPRMKPLFEKCGQLRMPVNIHIADPMWMYLPMDATNDGLMNAYEWRIDQSEPGLLDHAALIQTFENVVRENPGTTFIACHFANCTYDLGIVGKMLDRYPNLYVDNAARFAETATIPRFAKAFYERYQDRLLFGTDLGYDPQMNMDYATKFYRTAFRIMETTDDHFYEHELFTYHWPLYGLGLSATILEKIYRLNALKLMQL